MLKTYRVSYETMGVEVEIKAERADVAACHFVHDTDRELGYPLVRNHGEPAALVVVDEDGRKKRFLAHVSRGPEYTVTTNPPPVRRSVLDDQTCDSCRAAHGGTSAPACGSPLGCRCVWVAADEPRAGDGK